MVQFKTWKDSYLFLKEFGLFTCLQCTGCKHNFDTSKEHKDSYYSRFFCTKQVSMVEFSFQFTCREWENENGDKITDNDMDKCIFNIPLEVIENLDDDKKYTIEEIRGLVNGYEEVLE